MIEKLFNHPYLLHQTADREGDMPDTPVAACIDNGGTICLSQEGQGIVLNRASVPELYKLLKMLAAKEVE